MITFKLKDQSIQIPTAWEEVTYSQWLKAIDATDDVVHWVAIFTGQDYEILRNATISGLDKILEALSFINKLPTWPDYSDQCGPYKIPANKEGRLNIQFESLGQFEDMRQAMIKRDLTAKGTIEAYGKYVAIYLQKIRDKEYAFSKVPELEEEIKNFPAYQVMALGAFFFLKLNGSLNGTKQTYLPTPQNLKKSKRVLKSSARNSEHTRK